MGYGIYLKGNPEPRDIRERGGCDDGILRAIHHSIKSVLRDPLQRRLSRLQILKDELRLQLHPSAEDVEISVKDGEVDISAKTSGAGPGYHAMLAGILDEVATVAGVTLDWNDLQVGWDDRTGYQSHRDLVLLRNETIRLLRWTCHRVLEAGDNIRNFQINMPIGDLPITDAFATAPNGEFSREWFVSAANADDTEIVPLAMNFYVAWHGPDHAEYWANIGRYLMLWKLDWTVPLKDEERDLYRIMLYCYSRAREIDAGISVPEIEISEARRILESSDTFVPPRSVGAGYRRGMMERILDAAWSASIPGYFRREHETNGDKESNYFWFADREVHYTVLCFNSGEDGVTAAEFVDRNHRVEDDQIDLSLTPASDWITVRAAVRTSDGLSKIQAMYGVTWKNEQQVLVLTLVHEDSENGRIWAMELLDSVTHPNPEAE